MESKYITVALIAAICISLGGTFITLNKLSEVQQLRYVTGYVSSDTGTGTIEIVKTQSILVNITNDTIDFGICTGDTNNNAYYNLTSNDTTNRSSWNNCSSENPHFPGFIEIINDGNADMNLTLTTSATATEFIGGNNPGAPMIGYISMNGTQSGIDADGGCNSIKAAGARPAGTKSTVDNWVSMTTLNDYTVCSNFTYNTDHKTTVKFYMMGQIPTNPTPGIHSTTLTFTADSFFYGP